MSGTDVKPFTVPKIWNNLHWILLPINVSQKFTEFYKTVQLMHNVE